MNLLLTGAYNYTKEQIQRLEALGYQTFFVQNELKALNMPFDNIDATVCNGLFLHNNIEAFKKLKLIQLTSAGTDRVPTDYINNNNIRLETAQGVYSIPIAEWVILKILELFKKSRSFYFAQHNRGWEKQQDLLELSGKNALIIGFGSIGEEVAKRLGVFNVKITATDIRRPGWDKIERFNRFIPVRDVDKALPESDIVILTVPLTNETRHFINARRLTNIKTGAVLINVSRGGIMNEKALVEVLQQNKLAGAALDVFETEPLPPESPLWKFENVIVTPHNAYASLNNHQRMFDLMYKNLKDFMENRS